MSESPPCCQVQNLSHAYKDHLAVSNVSFDIGTQTIHGFVGPNGAGKTTTLKVLATLVKPQSGSVKIFGMDVARDFKSVRRRIGYMQDHFSMYRKMTVFEYLDFFGAAYGLSISERNKTIHDILALTDMDGRSNDFISGLSRGMQQRVSLARALVHDPDLLLLDEPASGLDPRARIELMEILKELCRLGKTIFISSHILTELATLCDHVTILDRGELKYTGHMTGLVKHQNQGDAYLIHVAELKPEVEEALRGIPGIVSVDVLEDEIGYRVKAGETHVPASAILQALVQSGAEVTRFQEDVKALSEAFMDLTQPGVRS